MHWNKQAKNIAKITILAFAILLISSGAYVFFSLPVSLAIFEGEECNIDNLLPLTVDIHSNKGRMAYADNTVSDAGSLIKTQRETYPAAVYTGTVKLFGVIPIKIVDLDILPRTRLAPCGITAGVKMLTEGVIVVGMNDIESNSGVVNPAAEAGIAVKDVILSANGAKLTCLEELMDILESSQGKPITLQIKRNEELFTTQVTPQLSSYDHCYKIGVWVRDSAAGIGTVTFVNPQNGVFGGLGHGICDMDTGQLMTVGEGILQRTAIKSVKKGTRGEPGELIGTFQEKNKIGRLLRNDNSGIYGVLEKEFLQSYQGKEIEIALRNEIKPGPAQILANIDGEKIETFSIEILKLNASGKNDNKNMMIRVTDPGLLRRTGGIVQGMSGSPIIQNGKLVGAVTHVLINDPTRGYAIFIENMLKSVQNLSITGATSPLSTAFPI